MTVTRSEALRRLKESEAGLRARGVRRAALFGSLAREEAGPGSDVDVLVELDPAAAITLFDYAAIVRSIEALFEGRVDVVDQEGLKPLVRPRVRSDAVYAF